MLFNIGVNILTIIIELAKNSSQIAGVAQHLIDEGLICQPYNFHHGT
jgi:hypothetical protein